jgi:hypothetical protein
MNQNPNTPRTWHPQRGAATMIMILILLLILLPLGLLLTKTVRISWHRGMETRGMMNTRYHVETALEIARTQMVTGTIPPPANNLPANFTPNWTTTFPIVHRNKRVQVTITQSIVRDNN